MISTTLKFACIGLIAGTFALAVEGQVAQPAASTSLDPTQLASSVIIRRDGYGTPHVHGKTDFAAFFGIAYVQAEDDFWQVEDNYILGIGRFAEAHGNTGISSDLLNRAFEIVPRSKSDYAKLDPASKGMCEAFAAGLNYYLEKNPHVKPRMIERFEPWHVLAFGRHAMVELSYRRAGLTKKMPRMYDEIYSSSGSNAWVVAPSRTKSGHAMLLINPHQPWFGMGRLYEAHIQSDEGLNFTGATFLGTPVMFLGHNEYLGWGLTTNQPDIADAWRLAFDDPKRPLAYRYGGGYRLATEWKETIRVKKGSGFEDRVVVLRKTHHGPVTRKEDDQHFIAVQIAKLYDAFPPRQLLAQMKAKSLAEFRAAMAMLEFQYQNHLYADKEGNIFYLYNGTIPKKDPTLDWEQPVDGSDRKTEWKGFHAVNELPQSLNPASGYLQNCNSTPYTVTDDGAPAIADFPVYMAGEAHFDTRRAKLARYLLRQMHDVTFEQMQEYALDNTMYWAKFELPRYKTAFEDLKKSNPKLAAAVEPYLLHLLDWDAKVRLDSTQATLCHEWYEQLYGKGAPAEKLQQRYIDDPDLRFQALVAAAQELKSYHGDWKVKWGDVYRIQRHPDIVDVLAIPFSDKLSSVPSTGIPGPMGSIFTLHYMPRMKIPFARNVIKRYGIIGDSYVSVVEFAPRIKAVSLIQFGQSADPKSPHYFDQAELLSQRKFKVAPFYPDEVQAAARQTYHPGELGKQANRN